MSLKKRKRLILKGVLQVLACLFVIAGGIGWFSGFIPPLWINSSYEMPLGDLQGIAVDSSDNIYCASQFYHRVQKYDSTGNFLMGFPIDTSGAFRIRINQSDDLEVATVRDDDYYRFSPDGELLEKKNDDLYDSFGSQNEDQCQGPDSSVYQIHSRFMFPVVVKTSPKGKKKIVVSTPFKKWIFMGPFPAWFFWMIGVLIVMYLNKDDLIRRMRRAWSLYQYE
ncbi:MAG: hypothetical protein JXM70_23160 [Pirellulales bacterium]|nr:hypothetical protein [Pirellulales bacterium]